VILLYEAKRKVFWTGVRISPPPPEVHVLDERNHFMGSNGCASDGGVFGFDRAKSNRVDSTTQIVVKSKTKINANDESYALAA